MEHRTKAAEVRKSEEKIAPRTALKPKAKRAEALKIEKKPIGRKMPRAGEKGKKKKQKIRKRPKGHAEGYKQTPQMSR